MLVMDGTEEIGRSGPLLLADRPVFTTDGRYAFTIPSFLDEIIVVSVDSGETTSVPCEGCGDRQSACHCQIVVPIGGSQIAWLAGPDNHLVRTDLAAESPAPRRTDITLPTEDGFLDEKLVPNLIAGTDGAALASYPGVLPGDDLLPPYLVTIDGKPRRLAPDRPDSIDEAVFSPDGTQVALTGNQESTCATVTVTDVASGKGETAPVNAEPGTTCDGHDVYIESLWWDRDGTLNTTFEVDDANTTAEKGQRRLEGGRWVAAGTGPAGEVRQLSAGTATIEGDAPGTLYVETDGERADIDTHVRYVTAAP
ncbi:hypothetical protein [Actinophytocola algeriensis]|uniref:WD40 repeat protein n=1 Tax=Actinophytocola algeriensis TaxID=1768010 RepID=A0A7W7VG01_9PSEU|nr:hypothetical protein [Actinophytocola algeriensis]MBB4908818.1 hypothetical protein [Actinophytocola algeriensis]MBE1474795.1 hypothetical protein [Actinophytocola algeriensis]